MADAWTRTRPRVFGALLAAVAAGLRGGGHSDQVPLPRMADTFAWVRACTRSPAVPFDAKAVAAAFIRNHARAAEAGFEVSVVAKVIRAWCITRGGAPWEGTASDLNLALYAAAAGHTKVTSADGGRGHNPELNARLDEKRWPSNPRALSAELRRVAPTLREAGIDVRLNVTLPACTRSGASRSGRRRGGRRRPGRGAGRAGGGRRWLRKTGASRRGSEGARGVLSQRLAAPPGPAPGGWLRKRLRKRYAKRDPPKWRFRQLCQRFPPFPVTQRRKFLLKVGEKKRGRGGEG